ncbi:dihydroxyacetone kinase subunit DhaL [Oceanobacillus polygoni]|uniref:phosphoenolpyruvate--glycerone phosphotransferase n=1 Tax=Oceanobacillus polygoni TaxID=1235259 RepID=A0A9X1CJR2_9BACI|nr:dihydroxyacetone kinase subunit DhaL [Oceanobacillus polygoni]MBP2078942.1 dihydroxyacetone kinase-like protein [Oceanobacillus polygoni]
MELHVKDIIQWLEKTNEKIQLNKDYLTALDQAVGDSDHGINMSRGFHEVVNQVKTKDYTTVSDVLKDTAMILMSKVGGASGPLFGTAFLRFSMGVKGIDPINQDAFTKGLEDALAGIMQRGKATTGEKTMVDVWSPVVNYFKVTTNVQADEVTQTAKQAMEQTKEIMATKGRASYFKEKSIGHIDPGAASSFYIFEALSEVIKGEG